MLRVGIHAQLHDGEIEDVCTASGEYSRVLNALSVAGLSQLSAQRHT